MNKKFIIASGITVLAIVSLIYSAVNASAKTVLTVKELAATAPTPSNNIRLGAKVADEEILYATNPRLFLSFTATDIEESDARVRVEYLGVMPDTLRVGRHVILEGNFDGKVFHAKNLLTQCPSKYEPPTPGAAGYN